MIVTIFEAHITPEKWEHLLEAYRKRIRHAPLEMKETFLIQDLSDKVLWRIISVWRSDQEYNSVKGEQEPHCEEVFRAVGIEPTRRAFQVMEHHQHI